MMAFKQASELVKGDPTCEYFNNFLEKNKAMMPEDWKGAFDHDQKLEPPEIEFEDEDS